MTLRHGKTLWQPLFTRLYLIDPRLISHEICDTLKKTSQAFQGYQDHQKPTPGAAPTVRGKIDESKEIVLEIRHIFSSRGITFARRVFLACYELIHKFGTLRKRTRSATTCNSQISKIFPGQAGISIGKWLSIKEKHFGGLCSQEYISEAQARLLARFMILWRRHRRLSKNTKIIKNQHRELHQPCAGKSTKVRKASSKFDAFFLPGDHHHAQSLSNLLQVDP